MKKRLPAFADSRISFGFKSSYVRNQSLTEAFFVITTAVPSEARTTATRAIADVVSPVAGVVSSASPVVSAGDSSVVSSAGASSFDSSTGASSFDSSTGASSFDSSAGASSFTISYVT